ncbi:MAG: HEAT repeat domain-containing protein [Planctomycetes bacterium]|nr:HEAT repeat domain-containing protein [Planctomycetota bacterium]
MAAILLSLLMQGCPGNPMPVIPSTGPLLNLSDTGPRRPSPPASPEGPRTGVPGPSTPAPGPSSPGSPRGAAGGPRTGGGIDLGPELDWADWWWLNAYEYLGPIFPRTPSTSGGDAPDRDSDSFKVMAESARAAAVAATADPDSRVRASAALTAGRLYGPSVRADLLRSLEDRDPVVRRAAIAGLGLSGAEEHVPLLLRMGTVRDARPLEEQDMALLSLGLGAGRGRSGRFAGPLRSFLLTASENDRRLLGPSAATSVGLVADEAALAEFAKLASDGEAPPPLRARALWAFRAARAVSGRDVAIACLEDRDPDVRRAAALALGRLGKGEEERVTRALVRAVETDGDTATRAFSLLSMGEVGGATARKELLDRIAHGKQMLRPWAAIGAGLLSRRDPDEATGTTLARRLAEERNRGTRAALALAIGLSKTQEGREVVRQMAGDGENSRERVFAALAISLGRDVEGTPALRRAIREIPNPAVRAIGALALSSFGSPGDAAALIALHESLSAPETIALSSLSLAWHGSRETLGRLLDDASSAPGAERRSAALLALGIGVSRGGVPSYVSATGGWDYLASLEASHFAALLWM